MIPCKEPPERRDDFQVWPVWWPGAAYIHAVKGGHSRVTICDLDFMSKDYRSHPPSITCELCIKLLRGS